MSAPTLEEIAVRFGCTIEQVRAQYRKNAESFRRTAERAEAKGKSINGYTPQQWREMAEQYAALAERPCAC